ncbi:MAG: hypothetical protein Q7R52_00030 [archaeon]|nr:hypothetical protein [archaeon]
MRTIIETRTQEELILCDICKKPTRHKCYMCKKDICYDCAICTDNDYLISGSFSGDYPDYYCKPCWSVGEEERNKILALKEQKEKEEEVLWQQWKGKCK